MNETILGVIFNMQIFENCVYQIRGSIRFFNPKNIFKSVALENGPSLTVYHLQTVLGAEISPKNFNIILL